MLEHLDVLIVGAGLSGIAVAHTLASDHPERTFALLEARAATGGTWDFFRYPGIRSDSDLQTFGYAFRPWRREQAIADGPEILRYLRETAAEHGIDRHVRLGREVVAASWSTDGARWLVDVRHVDTGERAQLTCSWLFSAGGYFRYDEGHRPAFAGQERFPGPVVHPQQWPADLDVRGKRVVVIGSGATAVTLVPALAETADHVTMVQRTPSYVLPLPSRDPVARILRRVLGERHGYAAVRQKNILTQHVVWRACQRHPTAARRFIRWVNTRHLPAGYPVDVHFNPPYDPWDQRLCLVPNGDLFRVIREGKASVETGAIRAFTQEGLLLESGTEVPADVIVSATGFVVQPFGGIALSVDGTPVDVRRTVAYKGMMLSGVPNFGYAIGYTNASWTLKIGLVCEHFSRLLAHMDSSGADFCVPELSEPTMPLRPLLDFGAGYVQRVVDQLPRQGSRPPWQTSMNYYSDVRLLRHGPVTDHELRFSRRTAGIVPPRAPWEEQPERATDPQEVSRCE